MLGLAEELLLEVIQEGVVKVLATKMSVTSSGLDGKDTASDVEKRNIESSSTKIEDQDVLFVARLAVETVGDGGGSWLVNDAENIEASDGTCILSRETL